jgi:hypothetical protein
MDTNTDTWNGKAWWDDDAFSNQHMIQPNKYEYTVVCLSQAMDNINKEVLFWGIYTILSILIL